MLNLFSNTSLLLQHCQVLRLLKFPSEDSAHTRQVKLPQIDITKQLKFPNFSNMHHKAELNGGRESSMHWNWRKNTNKL